MMRIAFLRTMKFAGQDLPGPLSPPGIPRLTGQHCHIWCDLQVESAAFQLVGSPVHQATQKQKKHNWGWVKTLVPSEPQVIAGIYGCSSH